VRRGEYERDRAARRQPHIDNNTPAGWSQTRIVHLQSLVKRRGAVIIAAPAGVAAVSALRRPRFWQCRFIGAM